jgi:SAM-dependent methyltransferase
MPTHQMLSGASDEELLQRMVTTYGERFGDAYWELFTTHIAPALPARPTIVDLGCGPALWLRDIGRRSPSASLFGYDITPAMITYGQGLQYTGGKPALALHDAATQPLPHAPGTIDLVSMSSVLHVFDEPLPTLTEIRRVLAPGGMLLLHDWIRQSLATYLAWRRESLGESEADSQRRGFRLFPVHNKYTTDDWRWLLTHAGFTIRHEAQLRPSHRIFIAVAGRARATAG